MPIVNVFFFPISFLRDEIFFACIAIKRSDSIRSKRKVSSISDRSDISDVPMDHDISGEESPGILSDDQPPESPSDAPDIEEGISTRGMPWLRVYPATDERMYKLLYNIFLKILISTVCFAAGQFFQLPMYTSTRLPPSVLPSAESGLFSNVEQRPQDLRGRAASGSRRVSQFQ